MGNVCDSCLIQLFDSHLDPPPNQRFQETQAVYAYVLTMDEAL